ncbi:hypothetical protein VTN02DRAFT_4546 [Thermoascus thermophilus]
MPSKKRDWKVIGTAKKRASPPAAPPALTRARWKKRKIQISIDRSTFVCKQGSKLVHGCVRVHLFLSLDLSSTVQFSSLEGIVLSVAEYCALS